STNQPLKLYSERVEPLKKSTTYLFSLLSFIIGILFMIYLRRVYVVGLLISFILIAFQTPTTKFDKTGETNDASIALLKFIGLNVLLYLAVSYAALLFFSDDNSRCFYAFISVNSYYLLLGYSCNGNFS